MKISIPQIVYTEVTLDEATQLEITKKYLKKLISPGEYLRTDGDGTIWLKQDDPHHYHGSISEERVRVATALDIAVVEVLHQLKFIKI